MAKVKKTIKKDIFLSQISVVIVSLLLTAIVFNICLNIYVRAQAKKQLVTAAALLQKYISTDLAGLNLEEELNKQGNENARILLRINRALKQTQFMLDINYAVIGRDKNQIYNLHSSEDPKVLNEEILPILKKENLNNYAVKKNKVLYFSTSGSKYASIVYPLKLQTSKNLGYLLIYSDLAQSRRLILIVNAILLAIILAAAATASVISNMLSRRISKPISELSRFAGQIGEREYSVPEIHFSDEETAELGRTMMAMAEKLSAYDTTMKTFLQNASHELRTPLMSIQGYAEGIQYGVVEDKDKAVGIIIDESKRLSALVEDLLYLSKIDSMQETLKLEAISGENLLRSCIERVNGIALSLDKTINLHIGSTETELNVDEEKFSRAIINILGNSLRYAKHTIEISLTKENNSTVIKVSDDGCGLASEDLGRIFDRFYKGKGGKYGLGLAITKTIIEKHRGSIIAGNNPQAGAYFKIIL